MNILVDKFIEKNQFIFSFIGQVFKPVFTGVRYCAEVASVSQWSERQFHAAVFRASSSDSDECVCWGHRRELAGVG